MKPGKHQSNQQSYQDFCWKVHDGAHSFFCALTLCVSYVTKTFLSLVSSSVSNKRLNYCVLCTVKATKENKNTQQRTLSSFTTIPLY